MSHKNWIGSAWNLRKSSNLIFTLFFIFQTNNVFTQIDTLYLDTILVSEIFDYKSISNKRLKTNEYLSDQNTSLDDEISFQNGIFLKKSAANVLTTISVRGATASQTKILWNDVKINNPMLGLIDLTVLELNGISEIEFSPGGLGETEALGGYINLKNKIPVQNQFTVHSKLNTLHNITAGMNAVQHWKKLNWQSSISYGAGNNAFRYKKYNDKIARQVHADFKNFTIQNHFNFNISQNHNLHLYSWIFDYNRQIPPRTTQDYSHAATFDSGSRHLLEYRFQNDALSFHTTVGYFDESNTYRDSLVGIHANNRYKKLILKPKLLFKIKNSGILEFKTQYNYIAAKASTGYKNGHRFHDLYFNLSYNMSLGKSEVSTGIGNHFRNDFSPLTFHTVFRHRLMDFWKMELVAERNIRRPSMNELFWRPGGNPHLNEEIGTGLQLNQKFQFTQHTFFINLYHKKTKNHIQWYPSKTGFYEVQNLGNVWSRGFELEQQSSFRLNPINLIIKNGYSYNRVNNLESNKLKSGTQLSFNPKHKFWGQQIIHFKNISLQLDHQYLSKINTFTQKQLDDYYLVNFKVQYRFNLSNLCLDISGVINNAFNVNYKNIPFEPMPLKNYLLNLRVSLKP